MEPLPQQTMEMLSPWEPGVFSLVVYTGVVVAMIGLVLFLTSWIGVRSPNPIKDTPYESGVMPTGSARFRYPVAFYLVATFFLIFDVEAAYIFSWAVAFESLGWLGWIRISFFIAVLFVSLLYVWFKGGLEWGPKALRR